MIATIAFWACWVGAGVANSLTDYFGFFHHDQTWENKYKHPLEYAPQTWYYRLAGVKYKERFLFSTNILVFLTDAFHAWQFVQATLTITAICLAPPLTLWLSVALTVVWGLTTHITLTRLRSE